MLLVLLYHTTGMAHTDALLINSGELQTVHCRVYTAHHTLENPSFERTVSTDVIDDESSSNVLSNRQKVASRSSSSLISRCHHLYTAHRTLQSVHCRLQSVHCRRYTADGTLHTVHYRVYTAHH
eukprot:Lankesteria_metandrocarpae@DN4257_c0_g1_i1.p1